MRGPSHRRRRRDARGASLVEFALIFPVFAMLLFGMITGGFALNDKQQMTYATREGARYAATVPAGQAFTSGTWATNVRDLLVARSDGTLTAADVCVSLVQGSPGTVVTPTASYTTKADGTACIGGQTFPVTTGDQGRRVQVTATKDAKLELIVFGSYDLTLDAQATARSESAT